MYPKRDPKPSQNHTKSMPKLENPQTGGGTSGQLYAKSGFWVFLDPRTIFDTPMGDPENQGPPKNGPKNLIRPHLARQGEAWEAKSAPPEPHGKRPPKKLNFLNDFGGILAPFWYHFCMCFQWFEHRRFELTLDRIFAEKYFFSKCRFFWNRLPIREKQMVYIF